MKKILSIILILISILTITSCQKTTNKIKLKTQNYQGFVMDISDSQIILSVNSELLTFDILETTVFENDVIPNQSDEVKITVSENKNENIFNVSNIKVIVEEKIDYTEGIRKLFVNDTLYLESYNLDNISIDHLQSDIIVSTVPFEETPNINNTSNFSKDIQYYISNNKVYLYINDILTLFIPYRADIIKYNDKVYYKSDLSPATVKWLTAYNKMSKEEQSTISFVPPEFSNYDTKDIEVITANAQTFSNNSGIIDISENEKIYIYTKDLEIKETEIIATIMFYNDSDIEYSLTKDDISLLGMSQYLDAFQTFYPKQNTIKISPRTLTTETITFESSKSLIEEIYIKSDSGVYRISEKNIKRSNES